MVVNITGGTGRFAGAHSNIASWGAVDQNTGQIVLRYQGTIFFAPQHWRKAESDFTDYKEKLMLAHKLPFRRERDANAIVPFRMVGKAFFEKRLGPRGTAIGFPFSECGSQIGIQIGSLI
jgi:hypothetical protein